MPLHFVLSFWIFSILPFPVQTASQDVRLCATPLILYLQLSLRILLSASVLTGQGRNTKIATSSGLLSICLLNVLRLRATLHHFSMTRPCLADHGQPRRISILENSASSKESVCKHDSLSRRHFSFRESQPRGDRYT